MSGKELFEELLKIKPDLRVLFMSGYMDDTISHYGLSRRNVHFIQKPFTPQELAEKLRDILD